MATSMANQVDLVENDQAQKASLPEQIDSLKLNYNQKLFLLCFAKTGYNISKTCRIINVTRQVYQCWKKNDLFVRKFNELKNERLDFAESILFQNMQHENKFVSNAAVIFFLKTQGRERGYEEHPKMDITVREVRSKDEIDAIVRAAEATNGFQIQNTTVHSLSAPMKEIPETFEGEIVDEDSE